MMWNHGTTCFNGGFSTMFGGGMGMMLFWGLILLFVVVYMMRRNRSTNSSNDAVDVLKRRYSMGEMSTEEYQERLQELRK